MRHYLPDSALTSHLSLQWDLQKAYTSRKMRGAALVYNEVEVVVPLTVGYLLIRPKISVRRPPLNLLHSNEVSRLPGATKYCQIIPPPTLLCLLPLPQTDWTVNPSNIPRPEDRGPAARSASFHHTSSSGTLVLFPLASSRSLQYDVCGTSFLHRDSMRSKEGDEVEEGARRFDRAVELVYPSSFNHDFQANPVLTPSTCPSSS
ncbi:hypothetical protein NMY22_g12647 [Coprinellus aureogranulatus]|nr:hypothetical protein NMY22_g12647 [Coprinellus aureogranulatus]